MFEEKHDALKGQSHVIGFSYISNALQWPH